MGKRWVLVVAVVALAASTCTTRADVESGFPGGPESASGTPGGGADPIGGAADLTAADASTASPSATASSASSTTVVPSTAPPAPAGAVPPVRRTTLLFAGDMLPHMPIIRAARRPGGLHDFGPLFAAITPIVSAADVAVCHMEVPVSPDNSVISGYPMFSAPAEAAPAMAAAGFDGCSTASNHSIDRGFAGVTGTLEAFDTWGLAHAGTGRTPEEAYAPAWYDAAGIKVAHLSYTYGTNGLALPAEAPWSVRFIDPAAIVADAQRVRAEGAEVVVVSVHWGVEYRADPTPQQRAVAEEITRSGAVDLVVGHHAHVPQPAERVNGRWVLFGLGNLVSNQASGCCSPAAQDGVIATAEVVVRGEPGAGQAEVERVVFTPVRVDRAGGFLVVPVAEALAGTAPRGTIGDDELRASLWRTTEVVARTADPDLVPSAQP